MMYIFLLITMWVRYWLEGYLGYCTPKYLKAIPFVILVLIFSILLKTSDIAIWNIFIELIYIVVLIKESKQR